MKIENIPGFEKTPDKVEYIADAMKVYSIAGMTPDINDDHLFENAKKLKKILDGRRTFFHGFVALQEGLASSFGIQDEYKKKVNRILFKYTGKTYKELIGD